MVNDLTCKLYNMLAVDKYYKRKKRRIRELVMARVGCVWEINGRL